MRACHAVHDVRVLTVLSVLLVSAVTVHSAGSDAMRKVETDDQGIQHATIVMDSYSYSPQELSVQAGKPVELTLHAQCGHLHPTHLRRG